MEGYPIAINVEYKDRLSRLTTFFRFFMTIPQYIVLYWAFDFVSGYFRWSARVNGYSLLLTDKYPPFSLD